MRQRPKPVKSKAKVPVAPKSPKDEDSRVRDLEKRLAEALKRSRGAEAAEGQGRGAGAADGHERNPEGDQPHRHPMSNPCSI